MNYAETPQYYEKYEQHRTFADVTALNEAVRLHLYYNAESLNKTDAAVFKLLSRFSCVVPGVSWMKAVTIAKHAEKSEKTIRRALKRLEDLGMIRRVPTIREKGGRGHDICVILADDADHVAFNARRFDDDESAEVGNSTTSCINEPILPNREEQPIVQRLDEQAGNEVLRNPQEIADVGNSESGIRSTYSADQAEMSKRSGAESPRESRAEKEPEQKETAINKRNTYVGPAVASLDASFVPDTVPAAFVAVCKPFFHAGDIYALWRKTTQANRHIGAQDVLQPAIEAVKSAVFMQKTGRLRKGFRAYYYGGLRALLTAEKRREGYAKVMPGGDWLTA